MCDIHKQYVQSPQDPLQEYKISKWYTFGWGIFSIIVAQFANNMGSLIEAVNVLGSLFYGVILGIFLLAFFFRKIGGNAAFYSAIFTELIVILLFWKSQIGFLWLNAIGAIILVAVAWLIHATMLLTSRSKA